ncbi:PilZ domain-containing protein [Oligoflexus tunisiensis]|uniref:PilZ domain-containing protein n=1 Tax=Oligoflexus tunisiensis TaxID=708132 RepID=UPI00114CB8CB|nr:PilZ domain-containing protein [Oligoflexus tunisiensis]
MSEQVWYLYQNGQQVGPFETQQVSQLFLNNMIAKDGYIFKVGWKDWRPIEEGYEALGIPNPNGSAPLTQEEYKKQVEKRLEGAPRATINGRVVVHNNGQLTIGQGVNISVGGIFVETGDQIFTIGESLKLSVRCDGLPKAFNAEASVIRFNTDTRFPVGYGLKFTKIEPVAQTSIQQLVDDANRRGDRGRFVK